MRKLIVMLSVIVLLIGFTCPIVNAVTISEKEIITYQQVSTIQELEHRIAECRAYKNAAHQMAEGARKMGHREDYCVIKEAQKHWAEVDIVEQMYRTDLAEIKANIAYGETVINGDTVELYGLEYVQCSTIAEYEAQIAKCKAYKDGAHEMAEGARKLGFTDDYCIIQTAKKEWNIGNELQKRYAAELKELKQQEEKEKTPMFGDIALQYSARYNVCDNPLNTVMGVKNFNGHRETYYSQRVLPGGGLRIPGRHVADDGTIRDELGYICVACDWSYMSYGSTLLTSLGPGKVYDCGCAYGTVDIYVDW